MLYYIFFLFIHKKHAHNTHAHIYALTQGTTKVSIIYYISTP